MPDPRIALRQSFQRPGPAPTPPPIARGPSAGGVHWAYVRNTRGFPQNWARLRSQGITGVLFNPGEQSEADLRAAYVAAQRAGLHVGIWDAPRNESAVQFANRMAGYSRQYRPELLSLDIEAAGKGYEGSPGWRYNEDLMRAYRAMAGTQETAVTMMPLQDDFNYGAYLRGGVRVFQPQAYGGGTSGVQHAFDPSAVAARLRANGVPEGMIQVLLRPGQSPAGLTNPSFYTVDDYLAGNRDFGLGSGPVAPFNPPGTTYEPPPSPSAPSQGPAYSGVRSALAPSYAGMAMEAPSPSANALIEDLWSSAQWRPQTRDLGSYDSGDYGTSRRSFRPRRSRTSRTSPAYR